MKVNQKKMSPLDSLTHSMVSRVQNLIYAMGRRSMNPIGYANDVVVHIEMTEGMYRVLLDEVGDEFYRYYEEMDAWTATMVIDFDYYGFKFSMKFDYFIHIVPKDYPVNFLSYTVSVLSDSQIVSDVFESIYN